MISQYETMVWDIHTAVDMSVDKLIHHPHIQAAARLIRAKEVVAFPTETVYGLGADARSSQAVRKIFEAKGRPQDNPLIVHIASFAMLEGIVDNVSPQARLLMDRFWPGPLTLVLPKGKEVCQEVTAGLPSVAVRMPDHPVALALILASQAPLAAPSANRSGRPSPTRAEHVWQDLAGRIAGLLDGGPTQVGLESTVLDLTDSEPVLLRPGTITLTELEKVIGPVRLDPSLVAEQGGDEPVRPRSPGQKYTHYAPEGELYLVSLKKGVEAMRRFIQGKVEEDRKKGERVAVLPPDEGVGFYEADLVLSLGPREGLDQVASRLYAALRRTDEEKMDKIYAETFSSAEVGLAVMNRLIKAAGGRVLVP